MEKGEELIFKSRVSANYLKRRSEQESSTEAQTSRKSKSKGRFKDQPERTSETPSPVGIRPPVEAAPMHNHISSPWVSDDNTDLPKTPLNRSPSPLPIPTESLDSPPEVYTAGQENNPFQACNYDNENEDGSRADAGEENDILLPDNTDQAYQFSAMLDGIDVAIGFQSLFTAVRKKTVYIHDIDQALARSGIILLTKEGTKIQKLHFGEKTLVQMREKALAKWQDTETTAVRNQVRSWMDTFEDHGYDREKSRKHISENAPSDGTYQKLWAYLVTAIEEFPESDSNKNYSESTAISSFILPLCRAFMSNPNKRVILNFIDSMTASGRSRTGSSSRKEPDLALEIKDRTNKTLCEVGIGEVTSHAQKGHKKKTAKDLVRVGLSLKDALDFIQDQYGVHDAYLIGWQVLGQIMSIYLMFKCGNLYIMVCVRDVTIPDSLTELGMISNQIKIWNDLRATVEQGLSPIFEAMASGEGQVTGTVSPLCSARARIETTRTPEFKTFLSRV
ncbi:hypothetical protein BGW38_005590 [Lunasporangiospora selenospora]|uniref:Uncharacterized protein n=1 Tax=Lunasporangiospora selenospora TaxID=979761 RepID=A0A9P6FNY7_9FUNG|nr:hypothetical protein BGW38_005590 [Lunasporangiospora selenospora]